MNLTKFFYTVGTPVLSTKTTFRSPPVSSHLVFQSGCSPLPRVFLGGRIAQHVGGPSSAESRQVLCSHSDASDCFSHALRTGSVYIVKGGGGCHPTTCSAGVFRNAGTKPRTAASVGRGLEGLRPRGGLEPPRAGRAAGQEGRKPPSARGSALGFVFQLQNQSELRAPTAEKAAFFLDAAIASRRGNQQDCDEDDLRNSHMLFTLHIYQYRMEKSGKGGSKSQGGPAGRP